MTADPAREIKHEDLGNLSVGAPADVAVLSLRQGKFGFVDMDNTVYPGTQKLECELTLRDGKVVYDLNGLTADPWNAVKTTAAQAKRFTTMHVQ
jgi:dihydroorotase